MLRNPAVTSLVLGALAIASAADATDRVALLIENTDYGQRPVTNETIGAFEMELRSMGFEVRREKNLAAKEIEQAIGGFLKTTPTNGTAVIYFSGHGISKISGQHRKRYIGLQGVGEAKDERAAERASFKLDRLQETIRKFSGAAHHHFILDFEAVNPALRDAVVPGEAQFAEVDEIEDTVLHRSVAKAIPAVRSALGVQEFGCSRQQEAGEGQRPGERWVNGVGMVFSWCPAGKFRMGIEPRDGLVYRDAVPVDAEISRGFWIGTYELTRREYRAIRGKDPNHGAVRLDRNAPVTNFGNGSADLAKKLTEIEGKAGRLPKGWTYMVPTEAEWEYACRAGSSTRYGFGDSISELDQHANFADRTLHGENPIYHYASRQADDGFGATLALVGTYNPNGWGIHDMHGNVSEWCRDHYFPKLRGGTDPFPTEEVKEGEKVIRGGAWCSTPEYCQSGFRNSIANGNNAEKLAFLGVRLVLKNAE